MAVQQVQSMQQELVHVQEEKKELSQKVHKQ